MTPDVNVLVAASRADHPHHASALAWLEGALSTMPRGGAFALLPMVTVGFLRVVTHPAVFPVPTPQAEALSFLRVLIEDHGAAMLGLGSEWPGVARFVEEHALAGGDVTDAWIAAAVRNHFEHLVTFDRGFERFLDRGELTILAAE